MAPLEFSILLLVFALCRSVRGKESLPSHNITLVSKDYSLFVNWLPPDNYPQGGSYTVQWRNSIDLEWKEIQHCRNITETICNLTCVPQELSNRYWVKIHCQIGIGSGFISLESESIDYTLHVELAPPVLRVNNTMNTLGVDITFTYPSCTMAIFHDLKYDLEIWVAGSKEPMRYENMHEPSMDINTTHWIPGKYCLHARTFFFRHGERKQSRFSEPACLLLHEKGRKWGFVALPFLPLLLVGVVLLIFCYKNRVNQDKMPAALDFSRYPKPRCVLEFDERELVVDAIQVTLGGDRTLLEHPSSVEKEASDEDSSSPIPYRETLRFHRRDQNGPTVVRPQNAPDSSSGSGSSQLNGESYPALIISRPFCSAKWVTEKVPSEFSLSKDSIAGESIRFSEDFPAAKHDGQEDTDRRKRDVLHKLALIEGPGANLFAKMKIRIAREQFNILHGHREGSQTSLHGEPENQVIVERNENDSSSCGDLRTETPLLSSSCKEGLEKGGLVGSSTLEPMCHSHQAKQSHYISRT